MGCSDVARPLFGSGPCRGMQRVCGVLRRGSPEKNRTRITRIARISGIFFITTENTEGTENTIGAADTRKHRRCDITGAYKDTPWLCGGKKPQRGDSPRDEVVGGIGGGVSPRIEREYGPAPAGRHTKTIGAADTK